MMLCIVGAAAAAEAATNGSSGAGRAGYGCESNPTGSPLGGGDGYTGQISPSDPRIVATVSDATSLVAALGNATAGQIVYVAPGAIIDLDGEFGTVIPAGVTLAGSRGSGDPPGRILQRSATGLSSMGFPRAMLVAGGDDVRITGLVLEGPDAGDERKSGSQIRSAVLADDQNNLSVDNCEISGWSHAGVYFRGTAATGTVHHNAIHHCQTNGFGYGVIADGSQIRIEANTFDYTRHAIACNGAPGRNYEACYNYCGPHSTNHVFDVHGYPEGSSNAGAGDQFSIHHNTFASSKSAVGIRGRPSVGATITNNRFVGAVEGDEIVYQANNYGNVDMFDNLLYASDEYYDAGPVARIGSVW